MENLVRYIIRASFSQERMTYSPMEALSNPGSRKAPENLVIRSLVRFNPMT
jgi:hypothetical protein